MTKTNLQIINFLGYARGYLSKNPEKSKWTHALERMEKRATKAFETYSEAMMDVQIEHAATDEKGALLTEPNGNLRFTKEGIRARNKAQKELLSSEIEIEPYTATELPKESLSEAEKEVCAGFVLPDTAEPKDIAGREGDGGQQPQE